MTYNPPPGWSGPQQYPQGQQPPPGMGGPPPGAGGPPPGGQPPKMGFFGALFDFGFNHFVTPSIVKVIYVLGLIGITLGYVFWVIAGFTDSNIAGVLTLLLGPVVAILYLAFFRMTLEFIVAVIRMSEDIHHRGFPGGR
ncbi:MAG: DUF4282 domain-containing protein [Pseudonocardiaceae bacterium]